MFMQPISIPVTVAPPRRPAALKIAAGAGFGLISMVLMPVYLVAMAAWVIIAAGIRTAYESALYTGEAIVGR